MSPKARSTNENTDKLGFIKIKNGCASRNTIKKMNRQLTGWKEIFVHYVSGKELLLNTQTQY